MFSAFIRSIPQISIFHRASSPPSVKALQILQSALSSSYPPHNKSSPPLNFNLEVIESTPPTADQLSTILSYQKAPTSELSTFLSAHPSASEQPKNAEGIVQLATSNPNVFKWPVVVDWTGGRASIGDVEGVKEILEALRKERDGEGKGKDEHQPSGWFS